MSALLLSMGAIALSILATAAQERLENGLNHLIVQECLLRGALLDGPEAVRREALMDGGRLSSTSLVAAERCVSLARDISGQVHTKP